MPAETDPLPGRDEPAASGETDLTVAVTGPTGTLGAGLLPLLQAEDRVRRVFGLARRPFDPAARGWTKMDYRRGDVRDAGALREAFRGADVVVHLAFLVTGVAGAAGVGDAIGAAGVAARENLQAVNVDGTLNAYAAAAAAGVRRFVYSSSVAAYGFHRDNPVGMTEDWPVRPGRLFYAREKAELELRLRAAAAGGGPALYLPRPSIVLGPHAVGAKNALAGPVRAIIRPWPRLPVLTPELPLQLVHERDAGQALLRCVLAEGPPGPYNIAADGILTAGDIARELGLFPLRVTPAPARAAARLLAALPGLPAPAQWVEAASHPAIMDTTRAKTLLGWVPEYTALETLRETLVSLRAA